MSQLNRRWVKLTITALLMALIMLWIGPTRIWSTLTSANLAWLGVSLLFTPLVIAIKAARWWYLARSVQPRISAGEALRSYLIGLSLAIVTPLAVGELGRGLFVSHGDRAHLTGKAILDKLIDLSTVSIFAGCGLVFLKQPTARWAGTGVLVAVVAGWLVLFYILPRLLPCLPLGRLPGIIVRPLKRFAVLDLLENSCDISLRLLALSLGLSLIGFVFFYAQAFIILRAFQPNAPLNVLPYFPIITLSTILPIAIGGVGIREWTAVLLLRQFGISESVSFNAFFLHFVIVMLLPALVGVYFATSFHRQNTADLATSQQGH